MIARGKMMKGGLGSGRVAGNALTLLLIACVTVVRMDGRSLGSRMIGSSLGIEEAMAENSMMSIGPVVRLPVTGLPHQVSVSAAPDAPNRLLACTYEADGEHARN